MRSLPPRRDDFGESDPHLTAALTDYGAGDVDARVLEALSTVRVLVPVVAVPTEAGSGASGLPRDKRADVAAVLMERRDGRRALLVFSGLATLRAWDPAARPVPASAADAASVALAQGADALLLDVAGPVMYVVETKDLQRLAGGHRLTATSAGYVWLEAARETQR